MDDTFNSQNPFFHVIIHIWNISLKSVVHDITMRRTFFQSAAIVTTLIVQNSYSVFLLLCH